MGINSSICVTGYNIPSCTAPFWCKPRPRAQRVLTDVCLALMGFLEGSKIPLNTAYPTQLSDGHEKPHKIPLPGHSQALEVLLIPVMDTLEKP